MHRKEETAGQRGSLLKGSDAAERTAGPIPEGKGRRASRCGVTLGSRRTCYAPLAFLASLARRPLRGGVGYC